MEMLHIRMCYIRGDTMENNTKTQTQLLELFEEVHDIKSTLQEYETNQRLMLTLLEIIVNKLTEKEEKRHSHE